MSKHIFDPITDSHRELPVDPDVVQPGVYAWPPHFTPYLLAAVFLGGCFGAAARYWVTLVLSNSQANWPVATTVVNLLGAFWLGLLLEGLARLGTDTGLRRVVRLAVGTGFIGSFTTYSTFAVELNLLAQHGHAGLAGTYALVSLVGGLLCSAGGIWLAAAHHIRRSRAA